VFQLLCIGLKNIKAMTRQDQEDPKDPEDEALRIENEKKIVQLKLIPLSMIELISKDIVTNEFKKLNKRVFSFYESCLKKKTSLRNVEKTLNEFNKEANIINFKIWSAVEKLIKIREREIWRKNFLLSSLLYYTFERNKTNTSKIAKHYINAVQFSLKHIFPRGSLEAKQENFEKIMEHYRGQGEYGGTDWRAFYEDSRVRKMTYEILSDVIRLITDNPGKVKQGYKNFVEITINDNQVSAELMMALFSRGQENSQY
ncbi:MAG: hypothetical protein HQK77_17380, partial [Desulfobacterales bacterium]|nr:hypothetical protein [Desulfobacterales bacterium]